MKRVFTVTVEDDGSQTITVSFQHDFTNIYYARDVLKKDSMDVTPIVITSPLLLKKVKREKAVRTIADLILENTHSFIQETKIQYTRRDGEDDDLDE